MAINNSDRDTICHAILDIVGYDYVFAARILAGMEKRFPTVAWRARFAALMPGRAEYTASGLSIGWWQQEVARLADAYKEN